MFSRNLNETIRILGFFEGRDKMIQLNPHITLTDCKAKVISEFNLMTQPKNINLYFRILKPPKLVENIMDLKDFDRIVISITEENSKLDMELEIPLNKEEIRANDDLSDLSAENSFESSIAESNTDFSYFWRQYEQELFPDIKSFTAILRIWAKKVGIRIRQQKGAEINDLRLRFACLGSTIKISKACPYRLVFRVNLFWKIQVRKCCVRAQLP